MGNSIETPNNRLGHLFILASALLPILAFADMAVGYGKNIMLTLSIIITVALVGGVIALHSNAKISKWLMWVVVASVCAQLVCNIVIFYSTGYNYSEFMGQNMFYVDTATINATLTVSCIIFVVSYIVYLVNLKKQN